MKYIANIYFLANLQAAAAARAITSSNPAPPPIVPNVVLGYGGESNSDLFILSVKCKNVYSSFSAPMELVTVGFSYVSPNTGTLTDPNTIQSGDIIMLYENNVRIYYGYILTCIESYSPMSGRTFTLECDTLLSQFMRQNTIQSFSDVLTLSPEGKTILNLDLTSNQIAMGDLMTFLTSQSIYAFANMIAPVDVLYFDPDKLNATTVIWYYPSTQSTKEELLLQATFFYQIVIFQDTTGDIVVTTPSSGDVSPYFQIVSMDNQVTNDPNVISYDFIRQEALLTNNVVSSLYYAGFFPNQNGPLVSRAIPNSTNFARSSFLYTSGFFSQVELDVESLQGSVLTDPVLLDLYSTLGTQGAITQIPPNATQLTTMIGLLSGRYLAQALTKSRFLLLSLQRNIVNPTIPVGQIFYLNNVPWFCISSEITLSVDSSGTNVENTIKLIGVPLYSITGGWRSVSSDISPVTGQQT